MTAAQLAHYTGLIDHAKELEADDCAALNGKLDLAFKLRAEADQYKRQCLKELHPEGTPE